MSSPGGGSPIPMPDDENQIRTLIERWATAVHTGDMDTVLATTPRTS